MPVAATQVWLLQAPPLFCQVPDAALQLCGCWPLQVTCPGAHVPVHVPPMQVELLQADPLFCQLPVELQFWGCWPLHCI
jgi:hypothetical protein